VSDIMRQAPEPEAARDGALTNGAAAGTGDDSARTGKLAERGAYDAVLDPNELVPGRSFADPDETDNDAWIMGDMLRQERAMARTWQREGVTSPGRSELLEAGWRQMVAVPDCAALIAAVDVTAVGFFGRLRPDVDHAVLFEHERRVTASFPEFAKVGFLSYYDLGPEHGHYGNLILFSTPDVPEAWHRHPAHSAAVAAAPAHYSSIRLHKGRIPGPFLEGGALHLERTTYLGFQDDRVWRALRIYPLR
jgi:hypothetical protein